MKKSSIDEIQHGYTGKKELDKVKKDLNDPHSALQKYIAQDLIKELPEPPKNSSFYTRCELEFIIDMIDSCKSNIKDIAFHVHDLDNFYDYWAQFANKNLDADLDSNFFLEYANRTDSIINWVKLQFARPRPYALAKELGMSYKLPVDKRFQTGAYPSGHSCEAYIFGYILSMKYPQYAKKILLFTRDVANSRIVAGVHFPSDVIAGKLLAAQIVDNNLHL